MLQNAHSHSYNYFGISSRINQVDRLPLTSFNLPSTRTSDSVSYDRWNDLNLWRHQIYIRKVILTLTKHVVRSWQKQGSPCAIFRPTMRLRSPTLRPSMQTMDLVKSVFKTMHIINANIFTWIHYGFFLLGPLFTRAWESMTIEI